jgi:hypothetical protein
MGVHVDNVMYAEIMDRNHWFHTSSAQINQFWAHSQPCGTSVAIDPSVHPSVQMKQLDNRRTDSHEILILRGLLKFIDTLHFLLKKKEPILYMNLMYLLVPIVYSTTLSVTRTT